jgi:hypothetical protein
MICIRSFEHGSIGLEKMQLILYSKPGCHLCEGLQEKLEKIIEMGSFESLGLEVRDITTREDWFQMYQYEVPVVYLSNRPSPVGDATRTGDAPKVANATLTPVPQTLDDSLTLRYRDGNRQDGGWTHQGTEDAKEEVREILLPRPSPRASVQQLEQMLCKYIQE